MTTAQHFAHWCRQLAAALEQAELDLWAPAPSASGQRPPCSDPSSH